MEHKSWPWKRKSIEKNAIASDKGNTSLRRNEAEIQTLLTDKADMERELKLLNDKLSSAISDCHTKDELAKKQSQIAQEAISGWEKTETEAISLKQQLDRALHEKKAGEERLIHIDAALKECMKQLRYVREEQEKRVHEAVTKASKEFERTRIILEENLGDVSSRVTRLNYENTQLSKALLTKEKVIEDFKAQRTQMELDFRSLMGRFEAIEKENNSLKYEIRVNEKELEIRNEEREFNRRSADVTHKQNLESVKKIAKLESECQRLRVLVRKRLPGPASIAKMKNEVENINRDSSEIRRKKSSDFSLDMAPDTPGRRIHFLTQKLFIMDEENKSLKEALKKVKPEDLQSNQEVSMTSMSDMGSEDKASYAESSISIMLSELEHLKNGKEIVTPSRKSFGISDIDLMDDFLEMEKLAVESKETKLTKSGRDLSEFNSGNTIINHHSWLDDVIKVVSEQSFITQRSVDEIIEDIKAGLSQKRDLLPDLESSRHVNPLYTPESGEYITDESLMKKSSLKLEQNVSISLHKMIELVESINISSLEKGDKLGKNSSETPTGYMIRLFQWKTSELSAILGQFVETCHELLHGKVDFDKFAEEITCTLEWILNHCFSLQDVSSMKDEMKNHFDWDDSRSESEINHLTKQDKLQTEENTKLKEELSNIELEKKDLERRLELESSRNESLMIQVEELKKTIKNSKTELETMKLSKGIIEEQVEKDNIVNEELETQIRAAKFELEKANEKLLYLENELENKCDTCQKLEATCLELQLQLSMENKDVLEVEVEEIERERTLQSDWEITAASEKLAECQETIFNLGKQLKALALPKDAIHNHVDDTELESPMKTNSQRSSLLEKMIADDIEHTGDIKSTKSKEIIYDGDEGIESPIEEEKTSDESLVIVPVKKKNSGGFLKKLIWKRKKGSSSSSKKNIIS